MSTAKPLTLDQLIAFCDELSGLARAGVPLGNSLTQVARDLPGRLAELAARFGSESDEGRTIEGLLADKSLGMPPVFLAVVQAGVKSGRLPSALESLTRTARVTANLQKTISIALVYPLLVLSVVSALAYFVLGPLTAMIRETSATQVHWQSSQLATALSYSELFAKWIVFLPPIFIGLAIVWWWQSRAAVAIQPGRLSAFVSRIPWVGRLAQLGRLATFSETLALLIEHDVPLPDAVQLSASATGDARIVRSAARLGSQIASGGNVGSGTTNADVENRISAFVFPATIRWMLFSNSGRDEIAHALRIAAKSYRYKADNLSHFLRLQLPILLSVGIGGTSVTAYTFGVVVPWFTLMLDIGNSIGFGY
jgi:general secretion pathway protein F